MFRGIPLFKVVSKSKEQSVKVEYAQERRQFINLTGQRLAFLQLSRTNSHFSDTL